MTISRWLGPVATAMVAVSRLGGKTAMLDNLGDDWAGALVLQGFKPKELIRVCWSPSGWHHVHFQHFGLRPGWSACYHVGAGHRARLSVIGGTEVCDPLRQDHPSERQALECLPGGRFKFAKEDRMCGLLRWWRDRYRPKLKPLTI